ncbi:MAG: hypothetical protein Fues2KO_16310 [Fuerstiella sp.]
MLQAAVAQRVINPPPGVELTGWGYYLERTWNDIRDDLQATALAVSNADRTIVLISLDLMVIDRAFTDRVRAGICSQYRNTAGAGPRSLEADDIMVCCTHTHNAPAAGGLLGVGACDPDYEGFAADRAVEAALEALGNVRAVRVRCASGHIDGLTFNRTREGGVVDNSITSLLLEEEDGRPVAVVVNHAAHPTITTECFPFSVSRDLPGMVCRQLEQHFAGTTALYLQGACGDTNFHPKFKDPNLHHEPVDRIANFVQQQLKAAEVGEDNTVRSFSTTAQLPTRRWTLDEIQSDRTEAERRLRQNDFADWEDTIGRSMTNRPADMVARHGNNVEKAVRAMCRFQIEWTDLMLQDYQQRPEFLNTEVQALRVGPLTIVSNGSEFFAPFARQLRAAIADRHLMIACYANERIGYLPDAHDIAAGSYAAWQSPKYCNQFPFTDQSGDVMTEAMRQAAHAVLQCR